MKTRHKFLRSVVGLFALLLVLPNAAPAWGARCGDVADRIPRHLNVLTINLAFLEIDRRDERLALIAEFAKDSVVAGEPIDVILLQEVVGGALVGTVNSAKDLQAALAPLNYELKTVFESGLPGVLTTANAILSRCKIVATLSRFLPLSSEQIQVEDLEIPITRNVMMARLKIPGAPRSFRRVNVYNTHLCAGGGGSFGGVNITGCTVPERDTQLGAALDFVRGVERLFAFFRARPHVFGGDFNIDNFRNGPSPGKFGTEKPLYDRIIGAGFIDSYAAAQADSLEELCVKGDVPFLPFPEQFPDLFQEWEPDEHCTTGVSFFSPSNPPPFEAFFDSTARRIDYIFGKRFDVEASEVVFNPNASPPEPFEPAVADHAGVLVQLNF